MRIMWPKFKVKPTKWDYAQMAVVAGGCGFLVYLGVILWYI